MAKEAGRKLIGYQLYPVFDSAYLMPRLMDAIIVRKDYEREFHVSIGIPPEKIYLLTDPRDVYSLSTIEDPYYNTIFSSEAQVPCDELGLTIINHVKFRPQIRQIFKAIKETKIPTVLSMIRREYTVMDSSEDQVIEELYMDDIKQLGCRFNLVEIQNLVPTIMSSDVVIGPTYVGPLELAARYHKKAWVYNPLNEAMRDIEGVEFINREKELCEALSNALSDKKNIIGMLDIVNEVVRS